MIYISMFELLQMILAAPRIARTGATTGSRIRAHPGFAWTNALRIPAAATHREPVSNYGAVCLI